MASVQKVDVDKGTVIQAVFDGMTNGKTVADVARELKLKPGTVRRWIAEDEEIYREYQRVRPLLGAALAEEAIRVARDSTTQTTAMDRVLIETLKWAAAKSAPSEYGEKQTVEHQGATTLQVKVIEEDVPVRNARRIAPAVATAVIAETTQVLTLPRTVDALDA